MNRVVRAVLIACIAAGIAYPTPAGARSLEDPPAGLHSASENLAQVLQHYNASAGGHRFHTRIATWRVNEHGLSGTYMETTSGEDFRASLTLVHWSPSTDAGMDRAGAKTRTG